MSDDIIARLRKRAEIRRQIPGRRSATEGKPDRIADQLDEAATEIERLERELAEARGWLHHYEKGDALWPRATARVWEALKKENAELKAEIEAMRPVIDACRMVPRYQLDSFVQSALDKYEAR